MPSSEYTCAQFWSESIRDLGDVTSLDFMRFRLVNRACVDVVSEVADLVYRSYMTAMPVQVSTTGNFSTATGTWTASTRTLTITMNSVFASTDVNKVVVFRGTADTYLGRIESFTSTTAVVVAGYSLPTSDIATVNVAVVVDTAVTSDSISLAGVRYMKAGQQINFELESTATTAIEAVTDKALRTWINSGQNSKKIVFTYQGDRLNLAKGSSLSSYGTMTLWYPRIPIPVTIDQSPVDIIDGSLARLGILHLSSLVAKRLTPPMVIDVRQEMTSIVASMYRTMKGVADAQLVKGVVSALA